MMKHIRSIALATLALLVACSADAEDEELVSSDSALKCPSPTKDREGFIACVKNQTNKPPPPSNASTSTKGKCSSLAISCTDRGCTCRGNGGPEMACSGSDCQSICCP